MNNPNPANPPGPVGEASPPAEPAVPRVDDEVLARIVMARTGLFEEDINTLLHPEKENANPIRFDQESQQKARQQLGDVATGNLVFPDPETPTQ